VIPATPTSRIAEQQATRHATANGQPTPRTRTPNTTIRKAAMASTAASARDVSAEKKVTR
jgi:hypothetical protein